MPNTIPIHYDGEIRTTSDENKLIDLLKAFSVALEDENNNVIFYYSGLGGYVGDHEILLDYMNRHSDRIELVIANTCASHSFIIFCKFKGIRSVLNGTIGICHLSSADLSARDMMNDESYDKFLNQSIENINNDNLKYYSEFMTIDQIKTLKKGKDVHFHTEELREIITKTKYLT